MDGKVSGSKAGITIAVMCAALMAFLDISIVNVALSDIRASFGTGLDQIGWVSTGYMVSNVVVIPMTGWLQRRFGFRRYFTVSILLFTAASALCGVAWNLPSLVLFRALQGLGGGAIIPTAQSILFNRYPKEEHGIAGALFGMGAVTGPLLGPTVGGYLIQASSWHWIFLVNVPFGIAAAALAWRFIEQPDFCAPSERIDLFGVVLLVTGMSSLQYVLEEGNREGWTDSTPIVVCACLAAITLFTFIVHELETENPIVDLRVFKNTSYAAGTAINCLLGTVLFSGSFLFSLYCGAVMRYTALDIGRIFLIAGAVQLVLMPMLGRLSGKLDGRYLIAVGILGTAASLWLNGHFTAQASFWDLARPQVLRAFGLAFVFVSLSMIALSDLTPAARGNATGLFNLTRELGGSIGTAWMGSSLDKYTHIFQSQLAERVDPFNPVAQEQVALVTRGVAAQLPNAAGSGYSILQLRIYLQALIRAFNHGFISIAILFALSVGLVLLLRRPAPGVKIEGAH
jgi:DHA2 family multidrug resistance protein